MHLVALEQLAEYALLSEDFEACLAVCRQAINAHPNRLAPYLIASRASNELGRHTEATAYLRQAHDKAGAHPEIKAAEVAQLRKARDWPAAIGYLSKRGKTSKAISAYGPSDADLDHNRRIHGG